MVDYLETGKWLSPRDALPPERQNVLAMVQGKPVVAYMMSSVWYNSVASAIGSTQAVDRWMHIPPVEPQPEVQVVVEALAASIEDLTLHREDLHRLGDPPEPVVFSGATVRFAGAFDRVGPIDNRTIARLRLIAEYL